MGIEGSASRPKPSGIDIGEVGGGGGVTRRAAGIDATGGTKDGGSPGGGDMLGGEVREVLGGNELGGGLTMTEYGSDLA